MSTLSPEAIDRFLDDGVVCLPRAIPTADLSPMVDAIWHWFAAKGVRRDDPTTWQGHTGMRMKRISRHAVFAPLASASLCGAINDLVGAGRWHRPSSWGQFAITMPQPGPPWELPAIGWHADCTPPDDQGWALFVLIHLADTVPGGGGTLLVPRSHRALWQYHQQLGDPQGATPREWKGFAQSEPWLAQLHGVAPIPGDRASYFTRPSPPDASCERFRVIEAHGRAGDVWLCHPFMCHAAAPNRSPMPRMMRIKMVPMIHGAARDDPAYDTPVSRTLHRQMSRQGILR